MDADAIQVLQQAGIDPTLNGRMPGVPLQVDEDGDVIPHDDEVLVYDGETFAPVALKALSELFVGDRKPPSFSGTPPEAYALFFIAIELAATEYCVVTGEQVRDKEFEELYNHLRRRPDGRHDHPLFDHLRAALRLYLSLRDVSEAEYEAVLRRLMHSARTFAMGYTSTNYLESVLMPFAEAIQTPEEGSSKP